MIQIEFTPAQVADIRGLIEGEADFLDNGKTVLIRNPPHWKYVMIQIEFTPAQVAAIRELIEGEIDIVDRNKIDAERNFPDEVPEFVDRLNELGNLLAKFPLPSEA